MSSMLTEKLIMNARLASAPSDNAISASLLKTKRNITQTEHQTINKIFPHLLGARYRIYDLFTFYLEWLRFLSTWETKCGSFIEQCHLGFLPTFLGDYEHPTISSEETFAILLHLQRVLGSSESHRDFTIANVIFSILSEIFIIL